MTDILPKQKCIMIIAGEASGDLHGSNLVRALRKKKNPLFFCGIGGTAMKNAGVKILVDASEISVVGGTEILSKVPSILKGLSVAKNLLKYLRPDLLVLIDFPDFNIHIGGAAKKLGIPVLYYISPQIWAWRSGRVKKIKERVDHMAVILPFEENFYREHDVPVTYVGHPLLDTPLSAMDKKPADTETEIVVGLLPGSRDAEVKRHLPVLMEAFVLPFPSRLP